MGHERQIQILDDKKSQKYDCRPHYEIVGGLQARPFERPAKIRLGFKIAGIADHRDKRHDDSGPDGLDHCTCDHQQDYENQSRSRAAFKDR